MFRGENLPNFVFVDSDGKDTVVELRSMAPRIRAIADRIGRQVPAGSAVGLMYQSEPNLVINWLACLQAGLEPLIMQYPTKKQSRAYWADSVRNTISVAGLAAIVADDYCAGLGLSDFSLTIAQSELENLPPGANKPLALDDFAILQLSSGTTGYRKGIRFKSDDLRRHVTDYNQSLGLGKTDKIVSWLPLYHDMGYVACFVMPMMLGIDVVMMDPMAWVRQPQMLFDAIERHSGTICYMPNFGFELMSKCRASKMPSMRWWISCSEPVSATTARKFLEATGTEADKFAPCYAMAENIFAVTIRRGIRTQRIDESEVISCGQPISNLQLKVVDEEIWARSPASLHSYIGGQDIRDAEGYYPTGDLGKYIDGELYVTGRKQDMLIQAGKKFMLSDIDLRLNELYPEVKGRAAAVQIYDARLGTQQPVVLIESKDFIVRKDRAEIADALKDAIGVDQIEVEFVPPRFLTKTSSGKFNRKKSAEHWILHRDAVANAHSVSADPVAELRSSFPAISWEHPVEEALDSLSLTVLRIILSDTRVVYDGALSLNEIAAQLSNAKNKTADKTPDQVIRIISLADLNSIKNLKEKHLNQLSERLGCAVTLEHMCLPPSPIILSDLIFHDYFQPRLGQQPFAAVDRAFSKLKQASIILVDDVAEMYFPPMQVYGVLSHNLERDPRSDLIAVRWQRYPQFHDLLPLSVVSGADIPLNDRSRTLDTLSEYLRIPVFRLASIEGFAEFTTDWEYRPLKGTSGHAGGVGTLNGDDFVEVMAKWIGQQGGRIRRREATSSNKVEVSDLAHYCSHNTDQKKIDKILAKFDSFCIAGQTASVPYIRKQLEQSGKTYSYVPSYAPEILKKTPAKFDCLLICGAQGRYAIDIPAATIMKASPKWSTVHIDDPELENAVFWTDPSDAPVTGEDWFYPFEVSRMKNAKEFWNVRRAAGENIEQMREERDRRRAMRAQRDKAKKILEQSGDEWQRQRAQEVLKRLSQRVRGRRRQRTDADA